MKLMNGGCITEESVKGDRWELEWLFLKEAKLEVLEDGRDSIREIYL